MAQQVNRKPRGTPDAVDAEQIQEMIDSPGWAWIRYALEEQRDSKMRDLVRPHTEVETATLRGAIASLNTALDLPTAVIAEARKTNKETNGSGR